MRVSSERPSASKPSEVDLAVVEGDVVPMMSHDRVTDVLPDMMLLAFARVDVARSVVRTMA